MFVIAGYPQGGIVFCNLVVFIFYMYIGSLVNLSSGAMSIPIKYPLSIYLACSVKKAGYSSQVLSAFLGTERTSRSIETQKGTRPMSDNVNRTRLDIKGFMHRSFTFLASKRWNALPPKVRESQDIASFNRSFEANIA